MGYTAIESMRKSNFERFGVDAPKQPGLAEGKMDHGELEQAVLSFIRNRCEKLRFDDTITQREAESGIYEGKSYRKGQIPYNMEMDIDRLCMERAIERFMQSGQAMDAFDVFYCYLEMFVDDYGSCKRIIELLSEFEANAGTLLMKHRDHYSHSVYVFILGLAIYETNESYRNAYNSFYNLPDESTAAHHYLQYWGLASLFHDIGYPFEIPFEQVKAFLHETRTQRRAYIAYHNMDDFNSLNYDETSVIKELYPNSETIYDFLASNIVKRLGEEYKLTSPTIKKTIRDKPEQPHLFGNFMDHAYFSSAILFKILVKSKKQDFCEIHADVLSAIMLHNSMFKFQITSNYKKSNHPLKAELHPLAYMLMLCDELQCWDRTSYGKNSKNEVHPMLCRFVLRGSSIVAEYIYDIDEEKKVKGDSIKIRNEKMLDDIKCIIKSGIVELDIRHSFDNASSTRMAYLSDSNFLSLHNFAVALDLRFNRKIKPEELDAPNEETVNKLKEAEAEFGLMSLEYQLSNVAQAKRFAYYLSLINCFYTDRPINLEMVSEFTEEQLLTIGLHENKRWKAEKLGMGWTPGEEYTDNNQRELFRMHKLITMNFSELDIEDQQKDTMPYLMLLKLIRQYDGLRIYRLGS